MMTIFIDMIFCRRAVRAHVQKNILRRLRYHESVIQPGAAMHTIQFTSPNPLDHVCRTLDTIRKMGFDLVSLHTDGQAGGGFRVSISLDAHDLLTVGTLVDRVSSYVGVYDLTCEADDASWRHGRTPEDVRHLSANVQEV